MILNFVKNHMWMVYTFLAFEAGVAMTELWPILPIH